jgi:L-aspartate semialdehyde sulfurtransferase
MGTLLPNFRNANYSTSGELSPLLNDPEFRTIGIGTRIFLGGAQGFVVWNGTQFHTSKPKNEFGIPVSNSATIAVIGNLKEMSSEYIRAACYEKYGVSMFVGIGIPIPILDADIAARVSVNNSQIETSVLDYGTVGMPKLAQVTYEELRSGTIKIKGKKVRTAPVSSLSKARKIADELKQALLKGEFEISQPVQMFPKNTSLKSLEEKEVNHD